MSLRRARERAVVMKALLLTLALAVAMALAMAVGSSGLLTSISDVAGKIVELRIQRVTAAALVGAALGLAGTLVQTLLANELADPYVLGVSGGASLGAVTSLVLAPWAPPGMLGASFALVTALVVIRTSRSSSKAETLLVGVVVSAMLSAATGIVLTVVPHATFARSANHWLFGGLGTPRPRDLAVLAVLLSACSLWTLTHARTLDRLSLGRDVATLLGIDVPRIEPRVLAASVTLTALAVALGGLIGFVGLAAPHLARRLVGATHARLLPMAQWIGAMVLVVADTIARTAFAPRELPVGLLTASVLGPWLLVRQGAR